VDWYKLDSGEVITQLNSNASSGLSSAEAARRLEQYGPNVLEEKGLRSPWRILFEQFTATMVLILLGAAVLSALLGEFKDAIAIGAIVILFALLGFFQEYRAERAMAALKQLATPRIKVLRDSVLQELPAKVLVPGDILSLEAGNLVPADIRILESYNLRVQEATLTGESEPVEKITPTLSGDELPLGDRRNLAYMGTLVANGRGAGVVVATGMQTELGKIANLLQNVGSEQTPLQKRLDRLGKLLAVIGLVVAGLVFVLGWLRGDDLRYLLLTAVSIAVAIVPEGLPAVVTITLALGAQRMLRRQALIRRLPAVETLGSVTVICSDKTGTLTENRMTVIVLDVAGHQLNLTESMHHRMPALEKGQEQSSLLQSQPPTVSLLLAGMALCNDAQIKSAARSGVFETIGDPTEAALLVAAAQAGLFKEDLLSHSPRLVEAPFDSDRKRMTTVHPVDRDGAGILSLPYHGLDGEWKFIAFTKGSVDGLLEISSRVYTSDAFDALDDNWRQRISKANDGLARQGMRVLGLAMRPMEEFSEPADPTHLEEDLVFVGLIGMIDPPRPEVRQAVALCKAAGIRPVMITGDHPLTALQIARELGIAGANGNHSRVITGQDLAGMSDQDLRSLVEEVSVYARVSPEHKLRIVDALQSRGHIVSMTGDGVNDAPALRRADIGVAMGITGTDVAKEAADMVLQDDNFATIVSAVEEGRTIYDNLRKFIKYSIAGNIGKVSVMLLAPFLGKPLPLLPLQLLWLNLITDGLLGLGLGLEPPEKDVMHRPPFHLGWSVDWRHRPGGGICLLAHRSGRCLADHGLFHPGFHADGASTGQPLSP
jgi:Ca2+-transporting ATPase